MIFWEKESIIYKIINILGKNLQRKLLCDYSVQYNLFWDVSFLLIICIWILVFHC